MEGRNDCVRTNLFGHTNERERIFACASTWMILFLLLLLVHALHWRTPTTSSASHQRCYCYGLLLFSSRVMHILHIYNYDSTLISMLSSVLYAYCIHALSIGRAGIVDGSQLSTLITRHILRLYFASICVILDFIFLPRHGTNERNEIVHLRFFSIHSHSICRYLRAFFCCFFLFIYCHLKFVRECKLAAMHEPHRLIGEIRCTYT